MMKFRIVSVPWGVKMIEAARKRGLVFIERPCAVEFVAQREVGPFPTVKVAYRLRFYGFFFLLVIDRQQLRSN